MMWLNRKGFTLVEIMIVVAIIGLLAAIAIPAYSKYRETAQKQACIANMKQIEGAIATWAIDNKKGGADVVAMGDLVPDYIKRTPSCPAGGAYTLVDVDTAPTCSIAAHVFP